jgi:hypothetical protein
MTKQQLHTVWLAHPKVAAFDKAIKDHIDAHGLTGLDGMNATLRFAAAWQKANGPLPDSGIICG